MKKHVYQPMRYFILAFAITWLFWMTAIVLNSEALSGILMILGLFSPAVISTIMILTSKDSLLKGDFKRKCVAIRKLNPLNLIIVILLFAVAVSVSILLSVCFGQSLNQFAFTEDFSFTGIGIVSAFFTLLLASTVEELGWHNYGVDSIAQYCTWFKATVIFGVAWALWHLPLFWIPGTYQCGLRETNIWFMVNFIVSVIPLAFITTWVYIKNNRSILACVILHIFINFMQEKIAMTAVTKCVETFVIAIVAVIILFYDKKMFFGKEHIGKLPDVK